MSCGILFACMVAAAALSGYGVSPDWSSVPVAELDPGGVTFDFKSISDKHFARTDPSSPDNIAGKAENVRGKKFVKYVMLGNSGGTYRLSFSYDYKGSGECACLVRYYRNVKGHIHGVSKPVQYIRLSPGPFLRDFVLPAESDILGVEWRAGELDKLEIRDLCVVKRHVTMPCVAFLMPLGHLDGTFAISRGQCGVMGLSWRKADPAFSGAWHKFEYRVALPPGVEFIDISQMASAKSVRTERDAAGFTHVAFRPHYKRHVPGGNVSIHSSFGLLVATERPEGDIGDGMLEVWYDGKRVSETARVHFVSVPPVKAVKPVTYFNGFESPENMIWFLRPESNIRFAKFMSEAGVGGVLSDSDESLRALWRTNGIGRILVQNSKKFANGYRVGGDYSKRPPEDRYVAWEKRKGVFSYYFDTAACPKAIYEERPFFLTNTVPDLAKMLKGSDGLWANWEPYHFDGKGCMCDRCRAGFAAFAGIPENDLAADWPTNMVQEKYRAKLQEYRSREHAKLVKTIDRHVRRILGEESMGFLPGVSWKQMSSSPNRKSAAEYDEIYYAGSLKWIEPWGPYVWWPPNIEYVYDKSSPLMHFFAAVDVRRQVDKDYPAPNRPKLMSFPHGVQGNGALTQPEHLEMALDCYFFTGWEASFLYFFPSGYDARYWAAFARATGRAAKYEGFLAADSSPLECRISPVAPYAVPCKAVSRFLPDVRNVSTLRCIARKRGDRAIAATFNFWDKGEAFLSLALDLPKGKYAVIDDEGRAWTDDAANPLRDSAEIAAGIKLHVGAARMRVFEFVPATDAAKLAPMSAVTAASLKAALEKAMPRLTAEAAKDAEEENGKLSPSPDNGADI